MPTAEHDGQSPPPVHLLVRLRLPNKPEKEYSYDFRQNVISLGRDPSNDIQIPLTTVSRNHARIFHERGDYFLEDLGSTHGTHHEGKKIPSGEKRLLRDGDAIDVMSFSITFKTTAGAQLDRQPGEKSEQLARRMVQEVLASLGGAKMEDPALRVMNGPDEGNRYEIREELAEITLGRSPECDMTLNDQNVSRRHCLVKRSWHGFTAQDLGSKNGVLVNGELADGPQPIKDGDELQVGGVKLTFIDPASRILDQMGGQDETIDPSMAANIPTQIPDEEQEAPEEESSSGYDEEPEESLGESYSEPEEDPAPDMDVEPPEIGEEEIEVPNDEEMEAMQNEIAKVQGRGGTLDVLILIIGGIFLLCAIGVVMLLLM